jgi:hypothetical protein
MRKALVLACLLFAAACGEPGIEAPTTHALTDETIATLPELVLEPGTLICTADGFSACPLGHPVSNRLPDGRILLWQPGNVVMQLTSDDSGFVLIAGEGSRRGYRSAITVTGIGRNRYRMIDFTGVWRELVVSSDGSIESVDTLPGLGSYVSIGFIGDKLIRQQYTGWDSDSGGRMQVAILRDSRDTVGNVFLDAPLPWLGRNPYGGPLSQPLLAARPVWSLVGNDEVVWSPGDRLMIERRTLGGQLRWRIDGNVATPVTEADLDLIEAQAREEMWGLQLTDEDFASMRARSDTLFPAVTDLTVSTDGSVLAALARPTTADSVTLLRIDSDGRTVGRLRLSKKTNVLVAVGDSVLLHQPIDDRTEVREVRWAKVRLAN